MSNEVNNIQEFSHSHTKRVYSKSNQPTWKWRASSCSSCISSSISSYSFRNIIYNVSTVKEPQNSTPHKYLLWRVWVTTQPGDGWDACGLGPIQRCNETKKGCGVKIMKYPPQKGIILNKITAWNSNSHLIYTVWKLLVKLYETASWQIINLKKDTFVLMQDLHPNHRRQITFSKSMKVLDIKGETRK